MKIKAIALDLDGTLLNSAKEISEFNTKILKKANELGIKIFIVTGRTYISAKKFIDKLNFCEFAIVYNGAKTIDILKNKVVEEITVPSELTKELIEIARKNKIQINLYQDNRWYVEKLDTKETNHYAKSTGLTPVLKDFSNLENYEMTKITLQDMENTPHFNSLCQEISKKFEDRAYTAKSQYFLFEILNKKVNKGVTLLKLLDKYGIKKEECIAFGDAMNDYEMLKSVGIGVAMKNSSLELLEKINNITEFDNNNDGVGKYLEKYFDSNSKL